MPAIQWIKLSTDFTTDEKIKMIRRLPDGDSVVVVWVNLLCLAGRINDNGYIYITPGVGYTPEELSDVLNHKLTVMQLALMTFKRYQMIEISDNDVIFLVNFGKYQDLTSLEKIREQGRKRVQKHRDKVKLLEQSNYVNLVSKNDVTLPVTLCNAIDKNRIDKNIREESIEIWNKILEILKETIIPSVFNVIFKDTVGIELNDNILTVGVKKETHAQDIEKRYTALLQKCIRDAGYDFEIKLVLIEE